MIIFTLTMYNANNRPMKTDYLFAKVRPYKLAGHVQHTIYEYTFEEGNKVLIGVRESVDNKEPDRVRKQSAGFYGCDWMIDEIIQFGRIRSTEERRECGEIQRIEKKLDKAEVEEEATELRKEWLKVKAERDEINNRYNKLTVELNKKLNWLMDPKN